MSFLNTFYNTAFNQLYFDSVEEILDSRHGSPFTAGGKRDYVRKWRVRVKDRQLGAGTVCRAPMVTPYAPYATEDGKEWDYQALCTDIMQEPPEDLQDATHRIVVAKYSTEMPQGGPPRFTAFGMQGTGSETKPWEEPPHIEFDSETIREAPARDLDGKPYINFARQPFKPAPTFEVGRCVLIYQRNETSHDVKRQNRYSFAVNSDNFLGEAPGTVMLAPPRAVLSWRGGTSYWKVTYRFRFNSIDAPAPANRLISAVTNDPIELAVLAAADIAAALAAPLKTWQPRILNCGLMQLQNVFVGGPNFRLPIPIFRNGGAVTEPVLLDANGREQKPDINGVWPEPVYVPFRQYVALPFTPLLVAGLAFP